MFLDRLWIGLALCCTALAACDAPRPPRAAAAGAQTPNVARDSTVELADDGGRVVRLAGPARRVISLVPSATETLIALGAADRVVGRTRYDVAPEVAAAASVGGGIDPSVEAVVGLRPDLVVVWEGDKRQDVRAKLTALGIPTFAVRAEDTTDVFRNIANLGRLVARDSAAAALAGSLRRELDDVRRSVAGRPAPSVFYVLFNDPPMTAGPGTFVGQLVTLAGGRSVFADVDELWPTVALEEVVRRAPEVIVVPVGEGTGEGGPEESPVAQMRARAGWRAVRAVRAGRVVSVPANLLNRPGPHIAEAARALRAAFHPELAPARAAGRP